MTEHKFTDEEIIRALHCLLGEEIFCKDCAFGSFPDHGFACKKNISKATLDLINRQREEIEVIKETTAEIRSEAIKEFAERLKTYYRNLDKTAGALIEFHIDEIVKEMMDKEE